jgi:hypothetical protein
LNGIALAADAAGKDTLPDIVVMTRLKILNDPTKPPPAPAPDGTNQKATAAAPQFTADLVAAIEPQYGNNNKGETLNAKKTITIKGEDCAAANVALLRLSLQPPSVKKGNGVLVRAVVPPAAPPASSESSVGTAAPAPAPAGSVPLVSAPAAGAPAAGAPPAAAPRRQLNTIECRIADQAPFLMSGIKDSSLADEVFVSFNLYPADNMLMSMTWRYDPPETNLSASAYIAVDK